MNNELERTILRHFYEVIIAVDQLDNSISDYKIVRDTQNKLKSALQGVAHKCTCIKLSYSWPCEVCQASGREMVTLRHVYNVMRTAKKRNYATAELQEILESAKKDMAKALEPQKISRVIRNRRKH